LFDLLNSWVVTEADEQAFHELDEQFQLSQQARGEQEAQFREERAALEAELHRLKAAADDAGTTAASERERAERAECDLQHARSQLDNELAARRIMEQRQTDLSTDVEGLRRALAAALADATAQTKSSELLRQELAQARAEFEDVKDLETRNAAKVARLLEDQTDTLRNLEDARARGEDLEAQIHAARAESADVKGALADAGREKDRLLRAQASEHDRIMRDHIAEADGDRAVLEHRFHELRAAGEDTERRLKDALARFEVSCTDAAGLKEELQRVERELREARHAERILRDDLKAGRASQSDFERRMEESGRWVAQILDVAIAFRAAHVRAMDTAQAMTAHSSSGLRLSAAALADSMTTTTAAFHNHVRQHGPHEEGPSPIDPSDVPAALDALRAFDHDHFLETIAKTGATIKKWQKLCKEYRERAKGKISFRNFAKGDLALFLPTRNSVSKPWAAFNGEPSLHPYSDPLSTHLSLVSFPHYFLQATGQLAEQLKTREWIVARITSIAERVVNHKVRRVVYGSHRGR
jgi:autophagy-related protein 11